MAFVMRFDQYASSINVKISIKRKSKILQDSRTSGKIDTMNNQSISTCFLNAKTNIYKLISAFIMQGDT